MSSPNSKVAWTRRRTNGETHVPFPLLVEQRPAPQGVERAEVLPAGHVERRTRTAVRLGEQLPEPRTRGLRWRGSGGALPPGLGGDGEGLGLHRAALHPSSLHAVGARRGARQGYLVVKQLSARRRQTATLGQLPSERPEGLIRADADRPGVASGPSVPSHRTWPGSTPLTCGGPDLLRRRPAGRLTESGPRWPLSWWRLRSSKNGQRGPTSMRQRALGVGFSETAVG
jgi:hypothetical protein